VEAVDGQSVIKTKNLSKLFHGVAAVDSLDLEVCRGEVYGFIGPNGAGKTTTIRMLLGLARPTSGTVEVFGGDPAADPEVRARIGYVGEEQIMYPYMTVRGAMDFVRGLYPRWDQGLADEIASVFRLPAGKRVGDLSKGMRSQLALILAMAPRPPLLVLDEPTGGLDPIARRDFLSTIMRSAVGPDQTVFMSSHILSEVERVVDRVGIIVRGRLVDVKTIEQLQTTQKRIRVVFQGEPPKGLLEQPGITAVEKEGHGYLITVGDHLEEIMASLAAAPVFALDLLDMSLEEVLVHHVGGDRRG
jgi:ABC-2 type transport system ATP-binding protein